jgi:chemotaxis protein histidine kinase CheA
MADDDLIKTLRAAYKEKLPEKIASLNAEWDDLLKKWDNEKIDSFYKLVHKLSGSSGSYGYPEISEATRELEIYLKELIHNKISITDKEMREIEIKLESIKTVINKIISSTHE